MEEISVPVHCLLHFRRDLISLDLFWNKYDDRIEHANKYIKRLYESAEVRLKELPITVCKKYPYIYALEIETTKVFFEQWCRVKLSPTKKIVYEGRVPREVDSWSCAGMPKPPIGLEDLIELVTLK